MSYLNVNEVESAITLLSTTYPSIIQLIQLPNTTAEGRTSHALRLGVGATGSKPVVMIIGGAHACEWGSAEIALNLASDIAEAYTANTGLTYNGKSFSASEIQTLLSAVHIVVFPAINPDGRHYSQSTASGWRKNRNTAYSGGDASRIGVDVNRNYDFMFDFRRFFSSDSDVNVSDDPGNSVYQGPSAFSEAETQNVRWLVESFPRTRWFIDLHSYSELMLYNWGDDENQTSDPAMNGRNPSYDRQRGVEGDAYREYIPANELAIEQGLSQRFVTDLQAVRGTVYTAQASFQLYPTAGASDDYVYARSFIDSSKGKIYGFCVEWGNEFQPPWSEMENIIRDTTAGLIGFCLATTDEWATESSFTGAAKQIAQARNQDGRLELFYVGTNDQLYHNWQTAPNNGWAGESALGGAAKQIAVGQNQDGRLELFYVGTNDQLYHNWQSSPGGEWAGERSMTGSAKQIAVGQNQDGRLELFYVGTDDRLYHNWQSAPNSDWVGQHTLAGSAKQIAVARNQDGRLELFYIGTDNRLYHNWQSAPNSDWVGERVLSGSAKQIAVGQNKDGRLELLYVGMDDRLYHNWQSAPNSDWVGDHSLPGWAKKVAVAANQDGRLELFSVGTNDRLYHNWQTAPNGTWCFENSLPGSAKQITVGRNQDGRLELFYVGTDNAIYHNWQILPNGGWPSG